MSGQTHGHQKIFSWEKFLGWEHAGGLFLPGVSWKVKGYRRNFCCRVPAKHYSKGGVKGTSPSSCSPSGAGSTNEGRARCRGRRQEGWSWRWGAGAGGTLSSSRARQSRVQAGHHRQAAWLAWVTPPIHIGQWQWHGQHDRQAARSGRVWPASGRRTRGFALTHPPVLPYAFAFPASFSRKTKRPAGASIPRRI